MTISFLRKASIGYLLLPNILFCATWFRQPYSTFLVIGLLVLMFIEIIKENVHKSFSWKEMGFLLLFASLWTVFSGVGGFVQQTSDFYAHNAKLYDLYKNPWPNYFLEVERYSCYYFGYFLVPAFFSKMAGELMPSTLFFWSVLGYFLAVSWVYELINRNKVLLFSFIWIRGIGHIILFTMKKLLMIVAPFYMPLVRSIFEQSAWVPNQLIAIIIVTCILVYDNFQCKKIEDSFFPISLVYIWAIFPAVCLTLIFLLIWVKKYLNRDLFRNLFSKTFLINYWLPGIILLPTIIYFSSSGNASRSGPLWEFENGYVIIFFYLIGFFIDWIILFSLLRYMEKENEWFSIRFINVLFFMFLAVSLWKIGKNNDWFYRGQIPFFIIMIIGILRGLSLIITKGLIPNSRTFIGCTTIIALAALIQIGYSSNLLRDNILVENLFPKYSKFRPSHYTQFPNVYQALKYLHPGKADAEQYLGVKDSFYEKYLSRK